MKGAALYLQFKKKHFAKQRCNNPPNNEYHEALLVSVRLLKRHDGIQEIIFSA